MNSHFHRFQIIFFFLSSDFNSYLTAKTTVTDKMVQGYALLLTSLGKELKSNFQSNICGCSFVILQAPLQAIYSPRGIVWGEICA